MVANGYFFSVDENNILTFVSQTLAFIIIFLFILLRLHASCFMLVESFNCFFNLFLWERVGGGELIRVIAMLNIYSKKCHIVAKHITYEHKCQQLLWLYLFC